MLKSIFPLSMLTFLSRVCGFIREVALYRALGGTLILDAFIVAFRLPNQTRRFFAEGSYNQALLPQLAQAKDQGEYDALLTQALLFLCSIVGLFSLSTYFFPSFWIELVAPSLEQDKLEIVCTILGFTGFYAFFMSLAAFYATILQLHKKLYPAALAPVITNLCLIVTLAVFQDQCSPLILGISVFFAGLCQFGYILHATRHYQFSFLPDRLSQKKFASAFRETLVGSLACSLLFYLTGSYTLSQLPTHFILYFLCFFCFSQFFSLIRILHPLMKKTLINFCKLSSVGALILINSVLDLRYISAYGHGAYSNWNLCERITDLPFGVLVSSLYFIFTSHYVTMHKQAVSKVNLELKAGLFILILVVPCTLGLASMAEPIIHIFYADKSLVPTATVLLRAFSLAVIPLTLNKIYLSIAIVRSKQNLILLSHLIGCFVNAFFNWYFDSLGLESIGIFYSTFLTVLTQAIIFEYYVPFISKVFRFPWSYYIMPTFGFFVIVACSISVSPFLIRLALSYSKNAYWTSMGYPMIVLLTCGMIAIAYLFVVYKQIIWLSRDFKQTSTQLQMNTVSPEKVAQASV